jgi:hypothetical protein
LLPRLTPTAKAVSFCLRLIRSALCTPVLQSFCRDAHEVDGVADDIGGALLALGSLGHGSNVAAKKGLLKEGDMTDAPLLSVSPKTMTEDEHTIAAGYRKGWQLTLAAAAPVAIVAYFWDVKWTIVVAAAVVIGTLNQAEGRLYDLCIRVKRANELLREGFKL